MKTTRVVKFHIKENHKDYALIEKQLVESKEIYNYANFILRQIFFKNSNEHNYSFHFINEYPELKPLFEEYLLENKQFTSLFSYIICKFSKIKGYSINTKMVQSIVRKLKNDWDSYWSLLNLKTKNKYDKSINIPDYKKKYNLMEYNNQTISKRKLQKGYIGTNDMVEGLKIHNKFKNYNFKCFRTFVKNDKIICEIIYEKEVEQIKPTNRVASIDLGFRNLFTIAFNYDKKGLVLKCVEIKYINQYFNKIIYHLKSLLPKNMFISKQINNLYFKRKEQLRNYIGYYTNILINLLIEEEVGKLIVGYNKEWKQNINLGNKNNQNFVNIPYKEILNIIKYKCEDNGIEYVEQEESFTSKSSFIDNDNIPIFNKNDKNEYTFSGNRIKRGLYKTKDGKIINADLNGALNIMRKANVNFIEELTYLKFNNIFTSKLI